jgi:hypothetical protein
VINPRSDPIRHGLSGFGRRNSLLVIYVAAFVLANRARLKNLRLHFSIYEMQSESEAGSGYSCQTTCDGALNSGIPNRVAIPGAELGALVPDIAELTDIAKCITAELEKDIAGHKTALEEANVSGLMLFAEAVHEGKIDAGEAFTTRGAVGRIQQPKIQKALAYIQEHMGDIITIERCFKEEVVGLLVNNPQKPRLRVRKVGTDHVRVEEFDFVHLANGTPWGSSAQSLDVALSSATPNHQSVEYFLQANGLMVEGRIKSGAHIGITGLSLSAYDYVPLVLRYTSIVEPTETGYKINAEKATEYQGLLKFLSRTGVPTPPRHLNAAHFASPAPILTSEEVHALVLQKKFDWLNFWTIFLNANIARSLGKLPKDLHYRQSMAATARMIDYARQTEAHRRGELTEVGLQRTGFWLSCAGQGFHADPAAAERALINKAPLTRTDRSKFLFDRASVSEVTSKGYVDSKSNKAFFDAHAYLSHCVASSPPAIHYLVARMFELGVATHDAQDTNESMHAGDVGIDVLLAPNRLDRKNDSVLVSLKGAVMEVVPGQPEYAKGRFLRASDETTLVHAIDMGMGGHGTRVRNSKLGEESMVGMRWGDTSDIFAATDSAASLASMTVLLSSIAAQGVKQPAERLLKYYNGALPAAVEFDEEVAQFESVWREVHEKHAFLVLCESVAANALEYLEYTGKVFHSESRGQLVGDWVQAKQHVAVVEEYHKTIGNIPAFDPPSVEEYFERFVDLSASEIQSCWSAHMKV